MQGSYWFHDEARLKEISEMAGREDWVSYQGAQAFHQIGKKLPVECQDVARIGLIDFAEFEGAMGLQCCLSPIDGHRKILAPLSRVKVFKADGSLRFEGNWVDIPYELVLTELELFIYLAPKPGAGRYPLSLRMRIKGGWRYLRHLLGPKKSK